MLSLIPSFATFSFYKKRIEWMLTRLTVVFISQYIQILNHYAVHLRLICCMLIILKKNLKKIIVYFSH